MPDNKSMAEHRVNLLKRRLLKDPEVHKKYSNFMSDLLQNDYAEEVPNNTCNKSDGRVWYLPHHSVVLPKKPDKVRVVFDCSARYKNESVNDHLHHGPDMTNTLVGVLMRFRQEPIALMSNVQAMFHQVGVTKEHRDFMRFLWWPGGDLQKPFEAFRMRVHIFGAASSPSCCNYALRQTAIDNEDDFDEITTDTMKRNFYVDDCLKSVIDEHSAIQISKQLTELLAKGGFHVTKWTSNSEKVIAAIPEGERAAGVKQCDIISISTAPMERALGIQWNIHSDEFKFQINVQERPATRRGILSTMSSVYDPLGFVVPILLPVKTILQELCRKGLDLDDPIPDEYLILWKRWLFDLPKLEEFSIARCMKMTELSYIVSCDLHHFSDASEVGYGTASYLRYVDSSDNIHCSFVMGKSRSAPLKTMTIPRLESKTQL